MANSPCVTICHDACSLASGLGALLRSERLTAASSADVAPGARGTSAPMLAHAGSEAVGCLLHTATGALPAVLSIRLVRRAFGIIWRDRNPTNTPLGPASLWLTQHVHVD